MKHSEEFHDTLREVERSRLFVNCNENENKVLRSIIGLKRDEAMGG
jgi:hypothetical protein